MCWRIDNGSVLSVQQCALSTAVWGMHCGLGASSQANRLRASCLQTRRGRGGRPEDSGSAAALSSLFALQWFSHQTRLLNQRPPLTKAANYPSTRWGPPPNPAAFVSPSGFHPSLPCFMLLPLSRFDLFSQVSVKWENTAMHLWPSPGLCATLSRPLWRMKKEDL